MEDFSLRNKTIIVTGASSGIGRECAISFSRGGANVIIIGRNQVRLDETFSLMNNSANHKCIQLDLTSYEEVTNFILTLKKQSISIDGIVNAAGISTTLPLRLSKPAKINEFYNTNVTSGFNLVREIVSRKLLNEESGSIVFISSVMGFLGEKGKAIYGLTKGALIAGTKSLAVELAAKNIRVNSVSPGVVITPLSSKSFYSQKEETLKKIEDLHPLGLGKPEDVANACHYLLSDAARWITGTNLIIDGGYSAR